MGNTAFRSGTAIPHQPTGSPAIVYPDICKPPTNPATPPGVPIPYPNVLFSQSARTGYNTRLIDIGARNREGLAVNVNAPPPIPCGNPACPHHTARVPATLTAQLPAYKAQGLLSPIVCMVCYRKFAGMEPKPAITSSRRRRRSSR